MAKKITEKNAFIIDFYRDIMVDNFGVSEGDFLQHIQVGNIAMEE